MEELDTCASGQNFSDPPRTTRSHRDVFVVVLLPSLSLPLPNGYGLFQGCDVWLYL
jgi:hypothetical protein